MSTRAKVGAGAFVAVLYAAGMSLRGDVLPGVVGGILAGILLVLVLNRIGQRHELRRRPPDSPGAGARGHGDRRS